MKNIWDNFDYIFCIHLLNREDRYENCQAQFKKVGLQEKMIYYPATYDPVGQIGLIKSLINAFQSFLTSKGKTLLLFEDDVVFINDPVTTLEKALIQLAPLKWDMLYFGANTTSTNAQVERVTENLAQIYYCFTSHAVAFNRQFVVEYLERLQKIDTTKPLEWQNINDVILAYEFQISHIALMITPIIATQMPGWSDLEKRYVNYDQFIKTPIC